jgi:hypothetical protein
MWGKKVRCSFEILDLIIIYGNVYFPIIRKTSKLHVGNVFETRMPFVRSGIEPNGLSYYVSIFYYVIIIQYNVPLAHMIFVHTLRVIPEQYNKCLLLLETIVPPSNDKS